MLKHANGITPTCCTQKTSFKCFFPAFVADFITANQHHHCSSLLSSVGQKHWLVGHGLEHVLRRQVQENLPDIAIDVQVYLKPYWPFLARQTVTEEPIPPELRLAICLYRLGRGDYLYTIAEMSGLGVSTVCSIVQEVCQLLVDHLWSESVSCHMPNTQEDFKKKILDMEEFWQFPCCWAAIDGCHIPMKCPPGGQEACKEYHNFKNFYSVVLMGMVDSHYRFVWGSCGFPGNSHDAVIFKSTDLWNSIQDGFIPLIGKSVGDVNVPPLIVGDSAFPLQTWLMKPFTNAVLNPQQRYFNYRLSRARMVTEGAYGQLKGRWRVLLRKSESNRDQVRITTLACMVLHNICIMQGDTISQKLDLSNESNGQEKRSREEIRKLLQMTDCPSVRDVSFEASKVRNALCEKLWLEKETGQVS